jgi:1-deoxy-D-xylulose-5-phosphate synthase
MSLLESLHAPAQLRDMSEQQLQQLADEIRAFLVAKVSATGGHLGPNLGVVELTLALHRVFDSPHDVLLWDTGHQAYVHKIVTGRADRFDTLRQRDGLSGYPSRAESPHDVIENSHASTALSYADGYAKAFQVKGESDRRAVAIVGDGSLTGGMAWEALNNIAAARRPVIIVVNDNGRSYSPTIGGLANHLTTLRTSGGYETFLRAVRRVLAGTPVVGGPVFDTLHGVKRGVKDIVAPQGMFEDLGLKYLGPVDGHDRAALEHVLHRAADFSGPVIVHAITEKGHGYGPAERDEADRFHGVGVIDPETGRAKRPSAPSWTSVFGEEMVEIGAERPDVVAITAAMLGPVGLSAFAAAYPDRCFDVGIAEQHAATSATGMALAGLHPVVAVYSTFLNRAFDQVLLDAALHRAPVTFVLDRAGITGDDGASHNGMWDLSILQLVPGLRLGAPRDAVRLRQMLREAVADDSGPSAVRFPKGAVTEEVPAIGRAGGLDVLASAGDVPDVLIVAVGNMAQVAVETAARLQDQGIGVRVVDPGWLSPVPAGLIALAADSDVVAVIEDSGRVGGFGSRVTQEVAAAGLDRSVRTFAIPQQFLEHASRASLLDEYGLTPAAIASSLVSQVSRRGETLAVDVEDVEIDAP